MERDRIVLCACAILAIAACASPAPPPEPQALAVGAVQHEIKAGLDQSAVLEALGPATRISTDSQRREVWTYENIASNRIDTGGSVGGGLIVLSDARSAADASSTDRRTLTLIIYYDDAKKVREYAYNYSPL
jgi:hypothetical protein